MFHFSTTNVLAYGGVRVTQCTRCTHKSTLLEPLTQQYEEMAF